MFESSDDSKRLLRLKSPLPSHNTVRGASIFGIGLSIISIETGVKGVPTDLNAMTALAVTPGVLAVYTAGTMMLTLQKAMRDAALLKSESQAVKAIFVSRKIEQLTTSPGFGRVLLRKRDVALVGGVTSPVWSSFERKRNKAFLPGHFEFELLKFAVTVEQIPWDPLCLLSEEILAQFPPPSDGKKQKPLGAFGFDCDSNGDRDVGSDAKLLSLTGKDALLNGRNEKMLAFMGEYAKNCCDGHITVSTQKMISDVLYRISQGLESNDDTSECAPMPSEFESRLVTEKGKKRMGILDWWQHGQGVDVRVDACTGPGKNPCGIKRNATQRGIGAEARCALCDLR